MDYFISDNKNFEILEDPDFDKLMELSGTENGVAEFLKQRAEKRQQQLLDEKLTPIRNSIKKQQSLLNSLEQELSDKRKDKELALKIKDNAAYLWDTCPEKAKPLLEKVFRDYKEKGEFNFADIEKVKKSFGLIQKVTKKNEINLFKNKLDTLVKTATDNKLSDKLKSDTQFGSFYSNQMSASKEKDTYFLESMEKKLQDIQSIHEYTLQSYYKSQDNMETTEQNILKDDKHLCAVEIQAVDKAITDVLRKRSRESIVQFTVERLADMRDDESVVINLSVYKNGQTKLNSIFKEMGLSLGSAEDTNSWYQYSSQGGLNDLWSPVIKASEAKKVMPKLVEYMRDAGITDQLAVPMKAAEIFSQPSDNLNSNLDQEELAGFVQHLQEKRLTTPMTYQSTFAEFPKEQYLFNGTQVSDDYFNLSKRAGRSGLIYASPSSHYAASYDGINGTATHDDYGIKSLGQVNSQNVQVGFINVYEQSKDDRYYANFGMEDAFSKNGSQITGISREMALLEEDSETYITPEKNPLKDKVLHISVGSAEYFVKLSEIKDHPFVQKILDNRKGNPQQSFDDLGMQKRFSKQQSEYLNGSPHNAQNTTGKTNMQALIDQSRGMPANYSATPKTPQTEPTPANTANEEKTKKNMNIKSLIMVARGIIQPNKAQPSPSQNNTSRINPNILRNNSGPDR